MSKFSPELAERIVGALKAGVGFSRAAAAEGITPETLRLWRRRGERDPEGPYGRLAAEGAKAHARFLGAAERCVNKAIAEGDVKAAQWKLERQLPDEYGPRQTTSLEVSGGLDVGAVDMDEVTEALRELRATRSKEVRRGQED